MYDEIPVNFDDSDGDENGNYLSLDTVTDFTDAEFFDGDGWYNDIVEKELVVKLDPEE